MTCPHSETTFLNVEAKVRMLAEADHDLSSPFLLSLIYLSPSRPTGLVSGPAAPRHIVPGALHLLLP
jgi:hypothetical protein